MPRRRRTACPRGAKHALLGFKGGRAGVNQVALFDAAAVLLAVSRTTRQLSDNVVRRMLRDKRGALQWGGQGKSVVCERGKGVGSTEKITRSPNIGHQITEKLETHNNSMW